ncbi:TRAFAC clade GTPase domain-containing protein [Shinella sp. M31]|uniref:TRAFAC clade GTPase domain-containing protein n=1 Tax=Shinella sp. M31 TaxID=3368615 RepID=UPI003B9E5297
MAEGSQICRNPTCDVASTGVCAQGHDPVDSCAEYDAEESELDPGDDVSDETTIVENRTRLRSSEVLTDADIWSFRKSHRTKTVSLIGEFKTGKTTLISGLYALFCKGPFAGFSFRGSRTLTGFARRHHLALESSGRTIPTTPRTSMADGVGFFHLNLVGDDGVEAHLLIADRSGEAFQSARTNTTMMDRLGDLKLSDRVCFLLDADRLTQPDTRAGYRREFKQTIWALLQNGVFKPNVVLEVLTTKIDKISRRENNSDVVSELDEYEKALVKEFAAEGIVVEAFRICVLPRANYELGLVGLEDLMRRWLAPTAPVEILPLAPPQTVRNIDRLVEVWSKEHTHG